MNTIAIKSNQSLTFYGLIDMIPSYDTDRHKITMPYKLSMGEGGKPDQLKSLTLIGDDGSKLINLVKDRIYQDAEIMGLKARLLTCYPQAVAGINRAMDKASYKLDDLEYRIDYLIGTYTD